MNAIDQLRVFAILDVATLVVRLLAVIGGVAAGGLLAGWLVKGLAKSLAFKSAPNSLLRVSRVLGGLIVGLVVAAWVFNLGGAGGIGGSGGDWWPFGQAGGSGTSNVSGSGESRTSPQAKPDPNAKTFPIHMRGGLEAEKDQRFYSIEGDQNLTWTELEKVLIERKKDDLSFVIDIMISKGSVDEQSEAVQELKNWAKKNDVAVRVKS
jgi:hypothetical protein